MAGLLKEILKKLDEAGIDITEEKPDEEPESMEMYDFDEEGDVNYGKN